MDDLRFARSLRFHRAVAGGPGRTNRTTFGTEVVDDLVAEVTAFADEVRGAAALGCVGWLNYDPLVTALLRYEASCLVINKPDREQAAQRRLRAQGQGFPAAALPALVDLQRRAKDGGPQILGPYSSMEAIELESLRVAGYLPGDVTRPLLHAKLLVLGSLSWEEHPSGMVPAEVPVFRPKLGWLGSANWTWNARRSLEVGAWTEQPAVLAEATAFLADVLAISEPLGSTAADVEPELAAVEYDDDAMIEALRDGDDEEGEPL